MARQSNWRGKTRSELSKAEAARKAGNEGKARVCARRAAGHIAGEYLDRLGSPSRTANAIVRLQTLASLPGVDPNTRNAAEHFLMRITPDHILPDDVDLIAEARWLALHLLGEPVDQEI